jgi:hypothetical protein
VQIRTTDSYGFHAQSYFALARFTRHFDLVNAKVLWAIKPHCQHKRPFPMIPAPLQQGQIQSTIVSPSPDSPKPETMTLVMPGLPVLKYLMRIDLAAMKYR